MKIAKLVALATGLLVCAPFVNAAGFNYNYADINVGIYAPTLVGNSGDGYSVAGSYNVSENFNLLGNYDFVIINGADVTDLLAGVGYHRPLGESVDLTADVSYRNATSQGQIWTGSTVTVGARFKVSTNAELRAFVGRTSVSGVTNASGNVYSVAGTYRISDKVGFNVTYFNDHDATHWKILKAGARFEF